MYVTSLCIDRFGAWSNLSLDTLSDGLNVVSGPHGSGKGSTVDFLRAIFGGFDSDLRRRRSIQASRGSGGSVTVWTPTGRQTISRYDDGSRDGRLTVERSDGAVIGFRHLHELMGDLSIALLDHAFFVDFNRSTDLAELASCVASSGIPLTDNDRDSEQIVHENRDQERQEQSIRALRREIAEIEGRLVKLNENPPRLHTATEPANGRRVIPRDRLVAALRAVDTQLGRWKRTLKDITSRKQRIAEIADRVEGRSPVTALQEPRRVLQRLENRALQLQETMDGIATQSGGHPQRESVFSWATVSTTVSQMVDDIHEVCSALSHVQLRDYFRRAASERDQLTRCESELRASIQMLRRRRRALVRRLNAVQPASVRQPDHEQLCECAAHPNLLDGAANELSQRGTLQQDLAATRREIEHLTSLRIQRLAEIDDRERRLADCQRKMERMEIRPKGLLPAASENLRRLTANKWRRMRVMPTSVDHLEIGVEDAFGRLVKHSEADPGVRDQAYLALCLAVVAASENRGWHVPLVVNEPFTNCPSLNVRDVLETLRDFGRGRQILCFTRHEHVASVAQQLDVSVQSLTHPPLSLATRHSPLATSTRHSHLPLPSPLATATGYLLYESDPIERAPSIDETNAARLRQIGISRVGDLLHMDPPTASAELQSCGVTVEMLESWQAQALLVCRLRGVRPYDARILVSCGIRNPEQLARLQLGALRARVKEFAASAHGQATFLSGSEFELSRVMDWIGAAQETANIEPQTSVGLSDDLVDELRRGGQSRQRRARADQARNRNAVVRNASEAAKTDPEAPTIVALNQSAKSENAPRYNLRPADPIASAPSIGLTMAKRLERMGIHTVADLLNAHPETVAGKLAVRRVDGDVVRRWQQQSELVCRIPRLLGHDAQLLVAAGVTQVEQLSSAVPEALWRNIEPLTKSVEGRRLLRGSRPPDLDEVAHWVESAQNARSLAAA